MPTTKVAPRNLPLEDQLVLARFVAWRIGLETTNLSEFNDVPEGFDTDGRSFMYHALLAKPGLTLSEDQLREYDENIRKYVERLKKNRGENLSMRYYQYLGLLFAELYLDYFFKSEFRLLDELKVFSHKIGSLVAYTIDDLRKLAYWMATGSGKTILMHINYWQFLHYSAKHGRRDHFENVLLITSGEKMTEQHLREFEKSGISAKEYNSFSGSLFEWGLDPVVKVIDIYKLKLPEDKKGEGVTVSVDRFGQRNLIFVDEGHKGNKEDQKWKRVREALADDGFTFEYSATFGQAIAPKDKVAICEYSKAILLDYSYRFFHSDGFGKDFQVVNMKDTQFTSKHRHVLLLANAISYYEQLKVFSNLDEKDCIEYGLEQPLWIFVGSKVTKNDEASEEMQSDILKVVEFLDWLLTENRETVIEEIGAILKGHSGILDQDNQDVFRLQFPEINFSTFRQDKVTPDSIYNGIFETIFQAKPGSDSMMLHLTPIKRTEGEIGLKVGSMNSYFGLIDIGNRLDFLKLAQEKAKTVVVELADNFQSSLFAGLDENPNLKILIGAKKFIEGWDCHRVSTMGLLDIGKGEGSQIIQLFGRGVRLHGKLNSMKRSAFTGQPHPANITILENLRIFGIDADYMKRFREIIEKEKVQMFVEVKPPLRTRKLAPFPKDLFALKIREGANFKDEIFELNPEKPLAEVDILPRAEDFTSIEGGVASSTPADFVNQIPDEYLELVDWDQIYLSMLELKAEKGWHNFLITKEHLKKIMIDRLYLLHCHKSLLNPSKFEHITSNFGSITSIVYSVLGEYLTRFYAKERSRWEKVKGNLTPIPIKEESDALVHEYRVFVDKDKPMLSESVSSLIGKDEVYKKGKSGLIRNAFLQNHLYQPLIANEGSKFLVTRPIGLNTGEAKFIDDLEVWLKTNPSALKDCDVFVLRNLTKGRGVGFFEDNSFYPDFILWIKDKRGGQKVIFIDPKGLVYTGLGSPKLKLHDYLRNDITPYIKRNHPSLSFDSFIISTTPYDKVVAIAQYAHHSLRKGLKDFATENHLLFQYERDNVANPNYLSEMFDLIGT